MIRPIITYIIFFSITILLTGLWKYKVQPAQIYVKILLTALTCYAVISYAVIRDLHEKIQKLEIKLITKSRDIRH